jgi:hypothetical protein
VFVCKKKREINAIMSNLGRRLLHKTTQATSHYKTNEKEPDDDQSDSDSISYHHRTQPFANEYSEVTNNTKESYHRIELIDLANSTRVENAEKTAPKPKRETEARTDSRASDRSSKILTTIFVGFLTCASSCLFFFVMTEMSVYYINGQTVFEYGFETCAESKNDVYCRYRVKYETWTKKTAFFSIVFTFLLYYVIFYVSLYVYSNNFKTLMLFSNFYITHERLTRVSERLSNNVIISEHDDDLEQNRSKNRTTFNNDPITTKDGPYRIAETVIMINSTGNEVSVWQNDAKEEDVFERGFRRCVAKTCRYTTVSNVVTFVAFLLFSFLQYVFVKLIIHATFQNSWIVDVRHGVRVGSDTYVGAYDICIFAYSVLSTFIISTITFKTYINTAALLYSKR